MLARPDPSRRKVVRPSQSLRQEYEEFRQQRIEDYKIRVPRMELMALGDRALRMIEATATNQLSFTEVLVSEHVDRLIVDKLKIPRFSRWKDWFIKIRLAQRQAAHWQRISPDCPLIDLALHLEPDDSILIVGAKCADHGYYLAAYDCNVTFLADDAPSAVAIEGRAASEALSARLEVFAVDLAGNYVPEGTHCLVIVDPARLFALDLDHRRCAVARLQSMTRPGGMHYYPSTRSNDDEGGNLRRAQLRELYETWPASGGAGADFPILLTRPG